jgi:hypothetical protein
MEGNATQSVSKIRLFNQLVRPLKEIQGFQKSHRLPLSRRDGWRFLAEISSSEIEIDLNDKFAALKTGFGLKRREISATPGEGFGLIETPYFRYKVAVDFQAEDLTKVIWQREVDEISEPNQIINPVFLEVFGKQFKSLELTSPAPFPLEEIIDRLEDLNSEQISVDYDKDLNWCDIRFAPHQPAIHLAGNRLQISSSLKEVTPLELFESLAEVQRQVFELLGTNMQVPGLQ